MDREHGPGVDNCGGLHRVGNESERDVDETNSENERAEPLVLFISLADEVTETGEEDHDQSRDDEVEKHARHDVRAVSGSEIDDLRRSVSPGKPLRTR